MKKSLVIGGNGFIGSHLVEALKRTGAGVKVLDLGARRDDIDWSGVEYQQGAFSSPDCLDAALEGVDRVYHLASCTVPGTSNQDPVSDIEGNLVSTVKLLERMRARRISRIIYFSSGGTVYGNPTALPVSEDHPTNPISSYGVVKLAVEKYLAMYQALYGLQPLVLRPSNPYGPRQNTAGIQGVIAAFLGQHLRGEAIRIWGDGSTVRDYIYIADLASLAATAGQGDETGVFNVGSGRGYSLNEIASEISRVVGAGLDIETLPKRSFDVREVVLDIECAKRTFGWTPSVGLPEGLRLTWDWLSSQPQHA